MLPSDLMEFLLIPKKYVASTKFFTTTKFKNSHLLKSLLKSSAAFTVSLLESV
jgi:hypothetical protein